MDLGDALPGGPFLGWQRHQGGAQGLADADALAMMADLQEIAVRA